MHRHLHFIDKVAIANGFITGVALYPQLIKALLLRSTGDLSALTFGLIFLNSIVWLLFGFHGTIIPLVVSSMLNVVAAGLLLFLAFVL